MNPLALPTCRPAAIAGRAKDRLAAAIIPVVEALEGRVLFAVTPTFQAPAAFFSTGYPNPTAIVSANFTGDGVADVAVASFDNSSAATPNAQVEVFRGNAGATGNAQAFLGVSASPASGVVSRTLLGHETPLSMVTGDFNHDGVADLALA